MENEGTKVRRGLFGMRSADVERLLADREQAARAAAVQIQAAEERAAAMQQRADALQERASALEAQLTQSLKSREQLEQEVATRQAEAPAPAEPALPLGVLTQEMARVLNATQEAGSRILARTRTDLERHLEDIDRRRQVTDEERGRLAAWTAEAEDSLDDLHDRLVATHDAVQHLRSAVEDAVGSARSTMSHLEQQLDEVTGLIGRFREAGAVHVPDDQSTEQAQADPPAEQAHDDSPAPQIGPPAPISLDAPAPPVSVPVSPQGPTASVSGPGIDGNSNGARGEPFDPPARPEGFIAVDGNSDEGGHSPHVLTRAGGEGLASEG